MSYKYRPLSASDLHLFKELLKLLGEAFEDTKTYGDAVPNETYLKKGFMELILGSVCFALLIACIRVVSSDPSEEKPADQEK